MSKYNTIEQLQEWEAKIVKCMEKVNKSTTIKMTFCETNINDDDLNHDFSAAGDIYDTMKKIKEATLREFQLDLDDVRQQIKRLQGEEHD